jgi:hypothetical protein
VACTAMLCSTAEVTVSGAVPETELRVAVMVEAPLARALTSPLVLTVATEDAEEVQLTWEVIFTVVPSE